MAEIVLTKEELTQLLDDKEKALKFFQDFLDDKVDIETNEEALEILSDLLAKFGTEKDENGQDVLSPLADQVAMKVESLLQGAENAISDQRIRSLNSDANQIKFDLITLSVYQEMDLVDKKLSADNMKPSEVSEIISNVKLNDKQQQKYSSLFVDAIMDDKALFEDVPPRILADAYKEIKSQIAKTKDQTKKDELLKRFATLASRIDCLILDFANCINYFYADPSNIADLHSGYQYMMEVRSADLKEQENQTNETKQHNQQINSAIETNKQKINSFLEEYDNLWNLGKLTPENAEQVNQRWKEITDLLAKENPSEDVLSACAKYRFLDNKGQPIPQFLDTDGKPQLDFKSGYTLNPDSRLAQIISLSRNDVCMQNVGNLGASNDDLPAQFQSRIPWKFAEINMASRPVQDAAHSMVDAEYVQRLWEEVEKNGAELSDENYQAALDAEVNKIAGFAERLGDKIGTDAKVFNDIFKPIENIDKLAKTRTEKIGANGRKQKIGIFKRALKNFGNAMAVSAGLTFVGKATGIAWAGAAIGTTLGIGRMIHQGMKWRKEQKSKGKPSSLKEFFKDKRNWGPAVTTGLASAAFVCMATGNPELAAAFGAGAVAVGTSTNAVNIYQDAIAAGYTKGQAIAAAVAIGSSGIAGAVTGNMVMNGLVNFVNNNTDSTLFQDKHVIEGQTQTVTEPGQRVYADGVIENNQRILNMWESPDMLQTRMEALMNQGLSHDDAVRYLMAFHDATDHNLGNGYFQQIGMNPTDLSALRNSISGTEVNLTPESLRAFEHFNPHISATNTVGYVQGATISHDLPANATFDSNGNIIAGNDFFSTYVNHDAPIFEMTAPRTETVITDPQTIFTPHELAQPVIGMFGTYEPRVVPVGYTEKLGKRAGALADKIVSGDPNKINDDKPRDEDNPNKPEHEGDKPEDENNPDKPEHEGDKPEDEKEPDSPGHDTDDKGDKDSRPDKKLFGHGFFHQAKEIIYKTMQATYHGMKKIQQGVNEMAIQQEKYKTELEKEKANRVRAENERKLAQLQLKISKLQKELEAKIKREKTANKAQRDEERLQLDHDILLNLKKLQGQVAEAKLRSENSEDLITGAQIKVELSKLEEEFQEQEGRNSAAFEVGKRQKQEEGRQSVRKTRAEGNRDVQEIKKETAVHAGQKIRNFFTGILKMNEHDTEAMSHKTDVEELKKYIEELRAQKKASKLTQAQYNAAIIRLKTSVLKKMSKEDQAKIQKFISDLAVQKD